MADQMDDLGIPVNARRPAAATVPPRLADRPRSTQPIPGQILLPTPTVPQSGMGDNEVEARTLIVGSGIVFSGDVASCDRLIVEGTVEASLASCLNVIVAEGGVFRGNGSTQNADIYGCIEGDLSVRNRLLIRSGGYVSGTITYDEIEIEAGGKISGAIQASERRTGVRAYTVSPPRKA